MHCQELPLKKHMAEMLHEKSNAFSKIFYFLPSTTDRKEKINQHLSSHPIACLKEDFKKFVPSLNQTSYHAI